jgi:hypothetical protein
MVVAERLERTLDVLTLVAVFSLVLAVFLI